ncbi:unnamed protein product [Macrosiphum euphorbiae]|nr:unnamed protein product [Macrosiphum euphorbiae]
MKSLGTSSEDDETSVIGKRFALQLKGMTEDQRLLSEKIISEVMYYGRIGKLTANSFQFSNPYPDPRFTLPFDYSQSNQMAALYQQQQQYQPEDHYNINFQKQQSTVQQQYINNQQQYINNQQQYINNQQQLQHQSMDNTDEPTQNSIQNLNDMLIFKK